MTDSDKAHGKPPDNRDWHEKRRWLLPMGFILGLLFGIIGAEGETVTETVTERVTETATEEVTEKVTETVTEEVTVEPEPLPEPAAEEEVPEELPEELQEGIGEAAMEVAWNQNTEEEKAGICLYYTMDKQAALDDFYEGAGEETGVSRAQARDFFDEKCG